MHPGRIAAVVMLLCSVLATWVFFSLGLDPPGPYREVAAYSLRDFAAHAAISLAMALLYLGAILCVLPQDRKALIWKAILVCIGLFLVVFFLTAGPTLLGVWLGKSDAWVHDVREWESWLLLIPPFASIAYGARCSRCTSCTLAWVRVKTRSISRLRVSSCR